MNTILHNGEAFYNVMKLAGILGGGLLILCVAQVVGDWCATRRMRRRNEKGDQE